jgi:hypothetical protein
MIAEEFACDVSNLFALLFIEQFRGTAYRPAGNGVIRHRLGAGGGTGFIFFGAFCEKPS